MFARDVRGQGLHYYSAKARGLTQATLQRPVERLRSSCYLLSC
jgi:hypothetical protein